MMCEAMKWNHLPESGGLYDQDPDLLDGFLMIFHERALHEEEEAKKRDNKMGHKTPAGKSVAGRRRR